MGSARAYELMPAILELLKRDRQRTRAEISEGVRLIASRGYTHRPHAIGFALKYLAKEGLLHRPKCGVTILGYPGYEFTNLYGLRWDAPHETAYPSTFLIDQHGVVFFTKIVK